MLVLCVEAIFDFVEHPKARYRHSRSVVCCLCCLENFHFRFSSMVVTVSGDQSIGHAVVFGHADFQV